MLKTLAIKNIALIDSAEIDFGVGLNILSGETGAGKSIIIDSLNFVLGGRADKTLIRFGETQASVEAVFDNINHRVETYLKEYEIDCEDELILSRTMTLDGKNSCRINGVKLTVGALKTIAGALVDIYGQHENSVLLNPDTHIEIIDNYGESILQPIKESFVSAFNELKNIENSLKKFGGIEDVNKKKAILLLQINEIKEAKLKQGEEEKLEKIVIKCENSKKILTALDTATNLLNGDSESNALDCVSLAIKNLASISDYDEEISDCAERLTALKIELKDIAMAVADKLDSSDFDEFALQEAEDRLDIIRKIEDKYGQNESEVLAYLEKITQEYEFYDNSEFEVKKLTDLQIQNRTKLFNLGKSLTDARKQVARELCLKIMDELAALGMKNTKMEVAFNDYSLDDFLHAATNNGLDSLEFLISPNLGQPLKPLAKIISGGEMSRLMLAIKKLTAQVDGINVMVFDEIDTGISGQIAQVVANKLYDISKDKQVLAVTHLPQLASMADNHFLIEKSVENEKTVTALTLLDENAGASEIARLVGGADGSEYALLHAKKMKENAKNYKLKG